MANPILFSSSLFCGIITIFVLLNSTSHLYLKLNIINGVLSSILNHGTTSSFLKAYDRISMVIGFLINMIFIVQYEHGAGLILLMNATLLYFLAKCIESDLAHIGSHIAIMICNVMLLQHGN